MAIENKFKGVLKTVEKAFKKLHQNGKYTPEDLLKTKEYKNLIKETSSVFESAILDNDIPEAMLKSLKEDIFIFSGLKTHAQLFEASSLLLTDENKKKSFSQFSKDVSKIKENYNQNYLEAEWQFAGSSAQSAANWADVSSDYDLQYRTASDDKVRDSHAILHNVTLAADDVFWIYYYPPNGWRCRCLAIMVRKGKFDVSDSKKSIANGEKATSQIGKDGKNKLAIFRFNPGLTKKIFPPEHPYTKVKGAKAVVKELKKENTIDLADFIKGEDPTNNEMKAILLKYADISPEDFRRGLDDVKFLKSTSYMMQHAMYHNRNSGEWVGGSIITLSSHEFSSIKFNPLEEFRGGLAAIKSGKKMTFNQEYSFESLWHEILHAKTKTPPKKLSTIGTKNMETVNQFVARHTYPDFIKKLGGEAIHQKEILENGYGYKSWITDFRANLKNRKIDEKKAAKHLMPFLMEDYSTIGSKVTKYLNENTK
ncbi:hypothetical protein GON26_01250 [Flavobacterium sp. GA093]|uniref:Phage head morphogenesis domain-containing protein n=1 Tax=Flavobacterium hydrocarbonoxydans TaxID=2683249 RepID=A0A6I4NED9_9FLAO|nr:phage minor head protein [Flavobacterium hydrocarbonoxydans]MWB92976.1 hypothetical protein [Flavobacterium hydrocarbonoxydans]